MKDIFAILLVAGLCWLTGASGEPVDCSVLVRDIDGDGNEEVVMQNRFWELTLRLRNSGRILRARYKPGNVDFTWFNKHYDSPDSGLLGDSTLQQAGSAVSDYSGDPWASYKCEVLADSPERVSVRLYAKGYFFFQRDLEIAKIISLRRGSSAIDIDYEMSYRSGKGDTVNTGLSSQSTFRVGRADEHQEPLPCTFFLPTAKGVSAAEAFPPQSKFTKVVGDDLARGWIACVGKGGEKGSDVSAALIFDYPKLDTLGLSFNYERSRQPKLNLRYRPVLIRDGETWRTRMSLVPFHGFTSVHGVGHELAGGVSIAKESEAERKADVRLVSCRNRSVRIRLGYRPLAGGAVKSLAVQKASLKAGETFLLRAPLPPEAKTGLLVAQVTDEGERQLLEFAAPASSRVKEYPISPQSQRVPRVVIPRPDGNLAGPPSPHVPWAKPSRAGQVRALVLARDAFARDLVELDQRVDIAYDYIVYHRGRYLTPYPAGMMLWQTKDLESALDRLRRFLRTRRYDVMIFNGMAAEFIPDDIAQEIAARVNAGMGLVVIGSVYEKQETPLSKLLPFRGTGPYHGGGNSVGVNLAETPWSVQPHYLTRHLPVSVLGKTYVLQRSRLKKSKGETLCSIDGHPLLATGTHGKGRIVSLNMWTDFLRLRLGYDDLRDLARHGLAADYPFHEYAFQWLVKMVLWSANKQPRVILESIDLPAKLLKRGGRRVLPIRMKNSLPNGMVADILVDVRDGEYRAVQTEKFPMELAAGAEGGAEFALSASLARGPHTIDVICRDAKGRVLDFGSAAFRVTTSASIESLTTQAGILGPDDERRVSARFKNSGVESAFTLVSSITDTYGRMLWEELRKLQLNPGDTTLELTVPPLRTSSGVLDLAVELRDDNGAVHRRIAYLRVKQPRIVSDLMMDSYSSVSRAHYPFTPRIMREIGQRGSGVGVGLKSRYARKTDYAWPLQWQRNNFMITAEHIGVSIGGERGQAMKVRTTGTPNEWPAAKVGDPNNIRRPPFIGQSLAKKRHKAAQHDAEAALKKNIYPFFYHMDDEMYFQHKLCTKRHRIDDLGFSTESIAMFRRHLKSEFGTLEALNRQWETEFASWEDVLPLAGRQARQRANIGPWLDFKKFLAKAYAEGYLQARDAIREIDPDALCAANFLMVSPASLTMPYYFYGPGGLKGMQLYHRFFDQLRSYHAFPAYRMFITGYTAFGTPPIQVQYDCWKHIGYGGAWLCFYSEFSDIYESTTLTPWYAPGRNGVFMRTFQNQAQDTGIVKTILTSTPDRPTLAILDSYPSFFSYYLEPQHFDPDGFYRKGFIGMIPWQAHWKCYKQVAQDLSHAYRLYNHKELSSGEIPEHFKILILPRTKCLSRTGLEKIVRFARRGGIVVADYRLAVMDDHGKPQSCDDLFDELFGIRRTDAKWDDSFFPAEFDGRGILDLKARFDVNHRETGIQVISGTALGKFADGAPNTIVKKVGQGYGIYLNYSITSYKSDWQHGIKDYYAPNRVNLRRLFQGLFDLVGIRSRIEVQDDTGRAVPGILNVNYTNGPLNYSFLLRSWEADHEVHPTYMVLPEKRHIYQVGRRKYFGHHKRFGVSPRKAEGLLFALLPYQIEGVTLQAPESSMQGGALSYTVQIRVSDGQRPGNHVVRLEFIDPHGKTSQLWTQNVLCPNGVREGTLDLALNETSGRWRIRATEVASGRQAERQFVVLERGGN